jgi:hypothetical protein
MGTRKTRPIYFRKNAQIKVAGVSSHTIENGMDFVEWEIDC